MLTLHLPRYSIYGFHDTANAVATVIYTKALRPRTAVVLSGICTFLGVHLGGTPVAFSTSSRRASRGRWRAARAGVQFQTVRRIAVACMLTMPSAMTLSGLFCMVFRRVLV